jgi:hypothetical protein
VNWKFLLLLTMLTGLMGSPAEARRPALDPLNRLHAGLSITDAPGVGMGFDSRMTNVIWIDVGAFLTSAEPSSEIKVPDKSGGDTWLLRNAIYLAPGLRLPHQQPDLVQWDLLARGGFAGVWASDAASDFDPDSNLSLFSGGDLLLKSGSVGVRLSAKFFYFKPYSKYRQVEASIVRPQYGAEAVYQF